MINFHENRSDQFFHRYELNCGINAISSRNVQSFKIFLDPDIQADDFQNAINSSLAKEDTSVVKCS